MNNIDKQYHNLLKDILENGVSKQDRTGTGTISVFGRQIRHKMSDGFPIITTKKLHWKSIVTELIWFLEGRTDLKWLLEQGNTIWVGDAYKNYLKEYETNRTYGNINYSDPLQLHPYSRKEFIENIKSDNEFAEKFGDIGRVYGAQWRSLGKYHPTLYENGNILPPGQIKIDQISNLLQTLKTNPDDRGMIVSAWNVGELDQMLLRPCHNFFQVYTRELTYSERYKIWFKNNFETGMEYCETVIPNFNDPYYEPTPTRAISLMWNQRSVDTPLGLPFNIASYGLLLEILAKEVNMVPDELIGNLGDCHIYLNQIEGIKEQLTREPYPLPKLTINTEFWLTETGECGVEPLNTNLKGFQYDDFILENYQSHPPIKIPLSN